MKLRSGLTLRSKYFLYLKGVPVFNDVTRDIDRTSARVDDNYIIPNLQGFSIWQIGSD